MKPANVLYFVRTWAFGGSHTIILLLLKHLPQERFHITCVPYDTRSNSDEVFVEAMRKQGFTVPEDRIPWRSRANWSRARNAVSDARKLPQVVEYHEEEAE